MREKNPPFVLDFVNEAEDIYMAFKPYYNVTTLQEPSDPNHLEQLKHELNVMQVYQWSEVVAFCQIFYLPQYRQNPSDHARMEKHIQPAVDRFNALDEEDKEKFYEKITAYTRFYSFISQIIPYSDQELEMLYSYGRYLTTHLNIDDGGLIHTPKKKLTFNSIGSRWFHPAQLLWNPVRHGVKSPTAVGTSKAKDENKPLSEIIQALNDRFGTDFAEEDRLFFEQIKEKASRDDKIIQTAKANTLEKFELGIQELIKDLMVQRMADNDSIVTRYMDDIDFQKTVFPILAKDIYKSVLDAVKEKQGAL